MRSMGSVFTESTYATACTPLIINSEQFTIGNGKAKSDKNQVQDGKLCGKTTVRTPMREDDQRRLDSADGARDLGRRVGLEGLDKDGLQTIQLARDLVNDRPRMGLVVRFGLLDLTVLQTEELDLQVNVVLFKFNAAQDENPRLRWG